MLQGDRGFHKSLGYKEILICVIRRGNIQIQHANFQRDQSMVRRLQDRSRMVEVLGGQTAVHPMAARKKGKKGVARERDIPFPATILVNRVFGSGSTS